MDWAVALEGRADAGGILLLLDDREGAESIAGEMRNKGHRVVVQAYTGREPATAGAEATDVPPQPRLW
jgi:hypothetical protein